MVSANDVFADALRTSQEEYLRAIEIARREVDEATARLADLEAKLAACELLLPDMEGKVSPRVGGSGIHAHIRPSELVSCKTQREAWRRIAFLSGGLARPTDGAQLLIDAKVADKDHRTVRSNALSWMFTGDDEWQKVSEGIYRWLKYEESDDDGEEECDTDQWPAEPSQIDDGDESPLTYQVNPEILEKRLWIIADR